MRTPHSGGSSSAGGAALLASGAARAAEAPLPSSPVVLNIMDVAGAPQIDRPGIERFQAQNPKLLSRFNVQLAPSPELAGKLKAMQNAAGRYRLRAAGCRPAVGWDHAGCLDASCCRNIRTCSRT